MASNDPFPPAEEIRAANHEMVAVVQERLPMGFYAGDSQWAVASGAALVRMADTVTAGMSLMDAGCSVDGWSLLRSLYEQVVTFAWVAIEPGPRYGRWFGDGLWSDLKFYNDATRFGVELLTETQVSQTRSLLGLDDEKADASEDCSRVSRRPASDKILPSVADQADEVDRHWPARIRGFHERGHLLSLRGLYLPAYRSASRSVHSSLGGNLDLYTRDGANRKVLNVSSDDDRLVWALFAPLFGIALVIAAQDASWIDEDRVRELIDRATGPDGPADPI